MTAESGTATKTITRVLHLVMGSNTGMSGDTSNTALVRNVDLYELDTIDLSAVSGLIINGNCDQIYLERHRDVLTDFVTAGGRIAVMGHPLTDFLPKLGQWRKLQYSGPKDLAISAGSPHPVWAGVDPADLSFRKEVSGFYGRGYSQKLPDNAIVTNYIGRHGLPVDYVYPLGAGEVLVHGGIDLAVFQADPNTSSRVFPQLLNWLGQLDRTDI
ncbi:hypothetical protein [Rhodococcus sp. OK302]|uniref:hypothetical protein n=1 Tax=Rhodococcus sp. OK302 TaxID=1882769 RepID=UPI000B93B654|nr:hypothetical protein [Rhodococcus sp. OK302]OYD70924.1 hypothetical protein BDB13_4567 [Rhodococcus sp. OK302]